MSLFSWKIHGNGKSISSGEVVSPDERLSWPLTIGLGLQHIAAMFGATFLVPIITKFPPTTTLFFSGVGTILFLAITKNRVPSYLGSSFAFLAPIGAAMTNGGMAVALGGVLVTGVLLALVGMLVKSLGIGWINKMMPPVVTGSIVMIIGLNLAGAAKNNFVAGPEVAAVTLAAIALIGAMTKGFINRISIFSGVVIGYVYSWLRFGLDTSHIKEAKWFGIPEFNTPSFQLSAILVFLPVVLVLIAENVGHVKAVSTMTGKDLDGSIGDALVADGVATALAGVGGGSGTTTYAENIGVMAATRVYSTAAYMVAAIGAILLSLVPKFGAVLSATPTGVLGGVGVVLYGMIGVLGAKIWIENRVDFGDSINLFIAATTLVIGIADMSWATGKYSFNGIVLGTLMATAGYHLLRSLRSMAK